MAWFTDKDIANAIIDAKRKNVNIGIILSSNVQNETVKQMFKETDINVHAFNTGDERGMMHHKFCLIDNIISINGSYNYSYNASNNNIENIHVSDDIAIYNQLFTEFERLKFNIDNQIDINLTPTKYNNNMQQIQSINTVESFSQQLHNLVYISAQFNTQNYVMRGYEKSKGSEGSVDIFKAEYINIKEEILAYATDESLAGKKNLLISNIKVAYDNKKADFENEKENELKLTKSSHELKNRQLVDNVSEIRNEKSILEVGNTNTGEKGLLQINKEIEKNKLDKKALEQSFIVKKFFNLNTITSLLFLLICVFYLSVFFSSALYKVFFEGNIIQDSLEAGIKPSIPQLIDANAIIKIFRQEGFLFGIISSFLFLFPLALTNLEVLGVKNKLVNNICLLIGLVVFDILVSGMVSINTDKIESLVKGITSIMKFWEVIKHGEFYLIFVFGALPLFITHNVINHLSKAYKESNKDIVDAEKANKIYFLEKELIELNTEKDIINHKIKGKEDLIKDNSNKLMELERIFNDSQINIDKKYDELNKQIKIIFDDFHAKIISGKIFTEEILKNIVSAHQTGFIQFLTEYYAKDEVAKRVKDIEYVVQNN